jgi:hypothetical protein
MRLAKRGAVSYSEPTMRPERAGERGQAMTEYVVLLFCCMLGLLALLTPMANAIQNYMRSIYFCVSLPFP